MTTNNQYLDKNEIIKSFPAVQVGIDELGQTDTYHEGKIIANIKKFDPEVQKLLIKCSIQIAVIGYGNKRFGFIRDKNGEQIQLEQIFQKYNILYLNDRDAKLKDDTLTARRLIRVFRYHIQEFIKTTGRPSYLWVKYAIKDGRNFIDICFPGAEHLVSSGDEVSFLTNAYNNLDKTLGTGFVPRLERVFIARGLIQPISVSSVKTVQEKIRNETVTFVPLKK